MRAASGSASTIRPPDRAASGELDTPATLLYCSAQFAPDRRVPAPPTPWPHGGRDVTIPGTGRWIRYR
ncbi:hypothetical protein D5R55_18390 [Burkholderia cenocepacia]|uniref:Uncharacterized protein n=1 Tax=Burkholderia cenocepacia TaxID=95486 RepID=A0A3S9NB70_9BURK|nr:hypothetical protein D5R55_18390 [Burkholderia cenocepacia]